MVLGREDRRDRAPQHLLFSVAEHALRAVVPGRDEARKVERDDRVVVRTLGDRAQVDLAVVQPVLGLPRRADVDEIEHRAVDHLLARALGQHAYQIHPPVVDADLVLDHAQSVESVGTSRPSES